MKIFLPISFIFFIQYFSLADWRGFRGTEGNGLIDGLISSDLAENTKNSWNADLPGRGLSSPIIVGELIILTASRPSTTELTCTCFSFKRWRKSLGANI